MRIYIHDLTLRAGLALSADDKLVIAEKLHELGIDYVHTDESPVRELAHYFERPVPIQGDGPVVLCDTNGGSITSRIREVCAAARAACAGELGIQAWNDSDMAVANTLAAVECGFTHVQGTINGYGPRCGMGNLCSVIAGLELKLGHTTGVRLDRLAETARFIADVTNLGLRPEQPYVGSEAFPAYRTRWEQEFLPPANLEWHACPVSLGNERVALARHADPDWLRHLETEGHLLNGELPGPAPFRLINREVRVTSNQPTVATVVLEFEGSVRSATCMAPGPVRALLKCLNECLHLDLELVDYKVRVLDPGKGTAARARVLVGWSGGFTTAGVSDDIIDASWRALVDASRVVLKRAPVASGYGWGV